MSGISVYILSIVGVIVLSVILDLILPAGQINKYVKGIMSFVLIFVIASPLPNLIKNGIDFKYFFTDVEISEEYENTIKSQQVRTLENELEKLLKQKGIENVEIQVWGDLKDGVLQISYIFVEMSNVVLTGESQHINKYEAIRTLLTQQTGIQEGQVVFNGWIF